MPAVLVHVVVQPVFFGMHQQLGAEVIVQVYVGCHIALGLQAAVGKQVYGHPWFPVGLQIFHINLSRNALESLLHARGPFAHGNAVHPCPWHIPQLIGRGRSRKARQILYQHLHILPTQPQQFDLSRSHGGVAVVHIHAGIGHKALSQVATGGAEQYILPHRGPVLGTTQTPHTLCLRLHLHLCECLSLYRVPLLRTGQHRRAQQQTI